MCYFLLEFLICMFLNRKFKSEKRNQYQKINDSVKGSTDSAENFLSNLCKVEVHMLPSLTRKDRKVEAIIHTNRSYNCSPATNNS